jgi:primase-polymerase (primpol)-like protein
MTALRELSALNQWVSWDLELSGVRPVKRPISATGCGWLADVTNSEDWTSYSRALAFQQEHGLSGVGFVFVDGGAYAGVDLDGCRDPETGAIEPRAQGIIDGLATYAEVSPSGRGVKLWLRGAVPGIRRRTGRIEMYDSKRFFAFTAQHLAGSPETIEPCQEALAALYAELFGAEAAAPARPAPGVNDFRRLSSGPAQPRRFPLPPPRRLDDEELLRRARGAANGEKFQRLFDAGAWEQLYASQSEADLALAGMLTFWAKGDVEQADRLFRRSALMRPKWDEYRGAEGTYGQRTFSTAARR